MDAEALQKALGRSGINASGSYRDYALYDFEEKGVEACMRLSPHYYNSEGEVADVFGAVARLARSGPW